MSDLLRRNGDRAAVTMAGTGETRTFRELDDRSTRLARVFDEAGLVPGDHVAVLLPNCVEYFDAAWAALRSGLYLTPVNWHLGPAEAGYIIRDCGARALVTSRSMTGVVSELGTDVDGVSLRLAFGGGISGFDDADDALAAVSDESRTDEREGRLMLYSSGTTGRPKGILPPMATSSFGEGRDALVMLAERHGITDKSTYLSPAPLYHAAPLGWTLACHRLGARVVVMERFDAEAALAAIARHRVTHAQFVPTHFVRMLRLPRHARDVHDLSSLERVIHAAAPCPVATKQQMIDWVGPILEEYYAGSEGIGGTAIGSAEWLCHPGSVGRSIGGAIHITDETGEELPVGETGQVWFSTHSRFEYHNDDEKTKGAYNDRGWATYGDIGHLDDDGYLYLTDRMSNVIISGGVNIYPQEAENVLTVHPDVHDVAVLGVPDEEMGERVRAYVVPAGPVVDESAFAASLIECCRSQLAHFKCPREVVLVNELPRLDSGKLLKRRLLANSSEVKPMGGDAVARS